jgi:hypothetical protein
MYDPVSHTLCKKTAASPGERGIDVAEIVKGNCTDGVVVGDTGAVTKVVAATVINSLGSSTTPGIVTQVHTLNKFEKSPAVIYQKLGPSHRASGVQRTGHGLSRKRWSEST